MVSMNHGGLPTAVPHGGSPPPYTLDTCDLNFLPKIWSKSMVHSPDLLEDTLKRTITTIPPSITTTHHDGGLLSPLSYTLANDDPSLPSTRTQRSRQNIRERGRFRNDGWTKWEEAVQLADADELEAKQAMAKTDWECWKKLEEGFEQFYSPFLSDSDEDDQDEARRVKRIRQRWNVDPLQHAQEMDMLHYSLSLPPTAWVFGTKSSAQRKQRKTRSKRAGTFISCAVGSGVKIIQEEAKNVCAMPHSGIRLSVINKVDNDSMKGDDDIKKNDKEMSIGGRGFSLHSPSYNCKGGIVLNIHNDNIHEGIDESAGAGGFVHTWEGEAQLILKIIVEVQGADLRRFDKHKKRATLWTLRYLWKPKELT